MHLQNATLIGNVIQFNNNNNIVHEFHHTNPIMKMEFSRIVWFVDGMHKLEVSEWWVKFAQQIEVSQRIEIDQIQFNAQCNDWNGNACTSEYSHSNFHLSNAQECAEVKYYKHKWI